MSVSYFKQEQAADLQETLITELIGLAKAAVTGLPDENTDKLVVDGLFATLANGGFSGGDVKNYIEAVKTEKEKLISGRGGCAERRARYESCDVKRLWYENEDIRSLKLLLLFGLRVMAVYARYAYLLGKTDETVSLFFYEGLAALGENKSADELLALISELGDVNLKCIGLLTPAQKS